MRTKTQVLQVAKKLIIEKGWCQGMEEDSQGRVCMIGALNKANNRYDSSMRIALATAINPKFNVEEDDAGATITDYNDGDHRRRYQVLAKFDKAIDLLKRGKI